MSTPDHPAPQAPAEAICRFVLLLLAFLLRSFWRIMLYGWQAIGEACQTAGERLGQELTPRCPHPGVGGVPRVLDRHSTSQESAPFVSAQSGSPHSESVLAASHISGMNVVGVSNPNIKKGLASPCLGCGSPPPPNINRSSQRWYVVTHGTMVGISQGWESAAPHVIGIPSAMYRSYKSQFEAEAAYRYAEEQGLLHVVTVEGNEIGQPHV